MKRVVLVSTLAAVLFAAVAVAGFERPASPAVVSAESRAKDAARLFLRTLNAKRFEQVCHMLSARFYRVNKVPDEARCVLGLRIGFIGTDKVRYKILGAHVDGNRAVVDALADGEPGRIVLVQERSVFKVLAVRGR
jgi:hypothetical protein